ncbi:hypothetical protein A4X13_0g3837 [Tilletia indica]|uniref:Uncharacterized protein n=1 Tax=Tilletia indica TaxID=43049 RepID=A0A177TKQ1_9BASI|nr:hypothetical protein A4X13_0g3837 [Tilletia indica]
MEARPLQPSPAAARHLAGDNTASDDLRGILLTNGERVVLVPMPSEWMTLCQLAAYTFSFDLRTHYPAFYLQLPHTSYHQQQLNEAEIPPLAFRSLKERDVVRVEVLARGGEERVVEGGDGEGEGMLGLVGAVGEEEGMLGLVGALEGVGGDGEEERMLGLDRAVIGGDEDGEGLPGLDRAIEDLLNSGLARGEEGEEEDRRVENGERLSSSEESQMRRVHADGDGERRADDVPQVQQTSNVGGTEEGNNDNRKDDANKEIIVEIEAAPPQSVEATMSTSAHGSPAAAGAIAIATGDNEGEKDQEGGDNNRADADRDRGKEVIVEIEVAPQQPMEATMSTSTQGSSATATAATAGASAATGGNNEGEDGEKVQEDVDTNNKNITPPTQQNATSATKKPRTRSSTGIKTATKKASASASVGTSARKSKRLMRKPATTTTTTGEAEQADQVPSVSMSSPSKKGIDGMPLGRPPAEAGKRRTYDEKRKLAVRSRSLKGKQALSGESSSSAAIVGGGEVGLDSGKGFKSRADGTTRMMDGSGSGVVENSDDGEEEEVEMGLEGQF